MRITTVPPAAACGRRAADYERRNAFLVFITNAADARQTLRPTLNQPLIVVRTRDGKMTIFFGPARPGP